MDTTNSIQLYDRISDPLTGIEKLGTFFAKSGMFGCERVEQGAILAMACMAERKSPLEITKKYHLLDGKLSMKSEAMLAEFHARGGKHKIVTRTPDAATIELTIDGNTATFSLTWTEAQNEPFPWTTKGGNKVLKTNWATPRARMQVMWARVVSDGVRAMAPEIVTGTYTPEEIEDFSSEQPAKPLLPTEPKAAKSEVKEAPKQVNTAPAPAPAATPAPEPAAATPPMPGTSAPVDAEVVSEIVTRAALAPNGKLTNATMQTLLKVIGEQNWNQAEEALRAKGKIKTSMLDLPLEWAQRIIDTPEKFLKSIGLNQ